MSVLEILREWDPTLEIEVHIPPKYLKFDLLNSEVISYKILGERIEFIINIETYEYFWVARKSDGKIILDFPLLILFSEEEIKELSKNKKIIFDQMIREYCYETPEEKKIIDRIFKMYNENLSDSDKYHGIEDVIGEESLEPIKIIPKENLLYKGTREFITEEIEEKFYSTIDDYQPIWFGSEKVATSYKNMYGGFLNIYSPKHDLKLVVVTDIRNYPDFVDFLNEMKPEEFKIIKEKEKDILESFRFKFGIGCDIQQQSEEIMKYFGYPDIWFKTTISSAILNPDIIPYRNFRSYGSGFIDRIFGRFMCYYCEKKGYDGYCSEGVYNFISGRLTGEYVICSMKDKLNREFDKEDHYIRDPDFINTSGRKYDEASSFYYSNSSYEEELSTFREIKGRIKFATLNVHSLESYNGKDTIADNFNSLIKFFEDFELDFMVLQEFPNSFDTSLIKYPFWKAICTKNLSNLLISRKKINAKVIRLSEKRTFLMFQFKGVKFCGTHLEIGKRYTDRRGNRLVEKCKIVDFYKQNVKIRKDQLRKITKTKPNIIMGDLNFANVDPEYDFITKTYTDTTINDRGTVLNGEKVDFIFSRKVNCESMVVHYNRSDHLPVVGVIY